MFRYLDPSSLGSLRLVSKFFRRAVDEPSLWTRKMLSLSNIRKFTPNMWRILSVRNVRHLMVDLKGLDQALVWKKLKQCLPNLQSLLVQNVQQGCISLLHMTVLVLRGHLIGEVTSSIGSMLKLKVLNLGGIIKISSEELRSLSRLTDLEQLHLSGYRKTFPAAGLSELLYSLSNLQHFTLASTSGLCGRILDSDEASDVILPTQKVKASWTHHSNSLCSICLKSNVEPHLHLKYLTLCGLGSKPLSVEVQPCLPCLTHLSMQCCPTAVKEQACAKNSDPCNLFIMKKEIQKDVLQCFASCLLNSGDLVNGEKTLVPLIQLVQHNCEIPTDAAHSKVVVVISVSRLGVCASLNNQLLQWAYNWIPDPQQIFKMSLREKAPVTLDWAKIKHNFAGHILFIRDNKN